MNDSLKKLYLEKCLFFIGIISMPSMYYLDFERLSNLSHIPMLPLFHSIVWTALFPFNFIYSIISFEGSYLKTINPQNLFSFY